MPAQRRAERAFDRTRHEPTERAMRAARVQRREFAKQARNVSTRERERDGTLRSVRAMVNERLRSQIAPAETTKIRVVRVPDSLGRVPTRASRLGMLDRASAPPAPHDLQQ